MLKEILDNGECVKSYYYKNGWVVDVYRYEEKKAFLCTGDTTEIIRRFSKKFGVDPSQKDLQKLVGEWYQVKELVAI